MIRYERGASFRHVNEIFKQLNRKDAQFVNPRGRFVDSPNVAIRYAAFDEDTGKAIGFIDGYVFEDATDTVILVMAVLEKYRKQHVAVELLKYMERAASQEGYCRLLARAELDNIPSIQMMKRFGFVHDGPIDPDDPQVHMQKLLKKGRTPSMDQFIKMQGALSTAFEAEIANDVGGEPASKTDGSIKSKFKAVRFKISSAFKSLITKLKSAFQRKAQEDTKAEPASELFGFGKSKSGKPDTKYTYDPMDKAVEWVKAHSNEIMAHNDDETFVLGVYNPKTASDDFKNSLGFFIEAKKSIQNEGINFGALSFTLGGDDRVILGFTYDPKNISTVTSIMYIEIGYSVPMSKLMDENVKEFTLGILGHLLWSINDPDAPIGSTKGIVMLGDVSFKIS